MAGDGGGRRHYVTRDAVWTFIPWAESHAATIIKSRGLKKTRKTWGNSMVPTPRRGAGSLWAHNRGRRGACPRLISNAPPWQRQRRNITANVADGTDWGKREKTGELVGMDDRGPSARRGEWLADPARWAGLRDDGPLGLGCGGLVGGLWLIAVKQTGFTAKENQLSV